MLQVAVSLFFFFLLFIALPKSTHAITCYQGGNGACEPFYSPELTCPATTTTAASGEVPAYSTLDECNVGNSIETGSSATDTANASYTLIPPLAEINDLTDKVTIKFNNPDLQTDELFICMESDMCIDDGDIRNGIMDGKPESWDRAMRGMTEDKVDEKTIQRYILKDGMIEFCGDGSSQLKGSTQDYYKGADSGNVNGGNWWKKMSDDNKAGCVENRDYFHAGKAYALAVYQTTNDGEKVWSLKEAAGIYINHAMPNVDVIPLTGLVPGTHFNVKVSVDKNKSANNKSVSNRNNYVIQVEGSGYSTRRCATVLTDKPWNATFPMPDKEGMRAGSVRISIKERVDEKNDGSIDKFYGEALETGADIWEIYNKVAEKLPELERAQVHPLQVCKAGFTYYQYDCKVSSNGKINSCNERIEDPNRADIKGLLSYFDKFGDKAADTSFPCNLGSSVVKDPSKCKSVQTALGSIPVDPVGFISRLFSIVLSVAGIGALLTIFYAGYRMLISRGDKEQIQKARERLVAAIVGLLFIIFSIALLSIITVDILKIPGFG